MQLLECTSMWCAQHQLTSSYHHCCMRLLSHHSAYVSTLASLKSAERSTILRCSGSALMMFCVVACGKQQNTASTPEKFTSSILLSLGTSAPVTRCGNTSENACVARLAALSKTRPSWISTYSCSRLSPCLPAYLQSMLRFASGDAGLTA